MKHRAWLCLEWYAQQESGEARLAIHVTSSRFFGFSHERSKTRASRLYCIIFTVSIQTAHCCGQRGHTRSRRCPFAYILALERRSDVTVLPSVNAVSRSALQRQFTATRIRSAGYNYTTPGLYRYCSLDYTGCFTTLGHNCSRRFPRSLWWKKFI